MDYEQLIQTLDSLASTLEQYTLKHRTWPANNTLHLYELAYNALNPGKILPFDKLGMRSEEFYFLANEMAWVIGLDRSLYVTSTNLRGHTYRTPEVEEVSFRLEMGLGLVQTAYPFLSNHRGLLVPAPDFEKELKVWMDISLHEGKVQMELSSSEPLLHDSSWRAREFTDADRIQLNQDTSFFLLNIAKLRSNLYQVKPANMLNVLKILSASSSRICETLSPA